jgi:hypothetical protein
MIALLEQRLHRVASKRHGAALELCGEPGIGKSDNTQLLIRDLPCRSASVHATSSNPSILRTLPKPSHVPTWLERALEQLACSSVAANVFAQTPGALLTALGPFVLHVEDLHETNPEQRDSWLHLAQQILRTRGVALIVTSRISLPAPLTVAFCPHPSVISGHCSGCQIEREQFAVDRVAFQESLAVF